MRPDGDIPEDVQWFNDGCLFDEPKRFARRLGFGSVVVDIVGTLLALGRGLPPPWVQDAAGRANSLDVLCDQQAGTFYDLALDRAITLFTEAPKAEFDELYFISDGAPTISHEGLQEARELKDMGVTIGALMLKGQDTILKREIVSSVNNQPLFFFVNDAASLEEKLADLAALAEGAVLEATVTLRHLDYDVIESYDVLRRATGNRFKIPEFLLPKKTAPDGLLIEYYYRLSSGLEKTYTTEIQWK